MYINFTMKPYCYLPLFLFLGAASCSHNSSKENSHTKDLYFNVDMDSRINLSDFYQNADYVLLEKTNQNLLGSIDKMLIGRSLFFILDTKSNKLASFNCSGKFIMQTENKGNGPSEYRSIWDFDVDTCNNTVEYFDRGKSRMVRMTLDGSYIECRPVILYASDFCKLSDKYYVFASYNYPSPHYNNDLSYNAVVLDSNNNQKALFLPITRLKNLFHVTFNRTVRYELGVNMFIPYDNKIYFVTQDSCITKYVLHYNKYELPNDFLDEYDKNRGITNHSELVAHKKFIDRLNSGNYIISTQNLFESKEILQYQFRISMKPSTYTALYHKQLSQTIAGIMENDLDYGPVGNPVALQNDTLYTCIYPSEIRERIAYVEQHYKLNGEALTRFQTMKAKLAAVRDTDNPVIGKFCIRKDLQRKN